jgi:hypothetical protein
VLAAYVAMVLGRGALGLTRDPPAVPTLLTAFPTMHAAWGLGFVRGIVKKVGTGAPSEEAVRVFPDDSTVRGQ